MKLFSLNSNPEIAQKNRGSCWGSTWENFIRQFSDGEIQVNIEESVRDMIFISFNQPVSCQQSLDGTVNLVDANGQRKYCQCGHALLRLCPPRPDCSPREPITTKLVANMLVSLGWITSHWISMHSSSRFLRYCRR